jgi:Tol biopolymer transport system component
MTPPVLDHAIKKCLAKLPEERWQSASDLASELKWIADAGSQAGVPALAVSHRKLGERLSHAVAALGIVLAIVAAAGWWRSSQFSQPRSLMRLSAELPPGAIINRFRGAQLALSPDGTHIVVGETEAVGKWHLAMRSMDQSEFQPLSGTDRAIQPFFSPDGQWIAYFADGKLKKIPVKGGAPVTLCDAPGSHRGASWGDDGNIVGTFSQGASGLWRVPSSGGAPAQVTHVSTDKGETAHAWPQVLPGSHYVIFTAYGSGAYDDAKIDVISRKSGERKTLYAGGSFGRYLPSGHVVYLLRNTLFVAPFDLGRLAVTGDPQPVLEDVNSNDQGGGDFDFSRTGTLVYVSWKVEISFPYSIWWLDSTGQTKPLHDTSGLYESPRFSPDGKRLAFEVATRPVQADIWVKDLERDTMSRLTHLQGRNNKPLWTPDGKSIVFASGYRAAPGLFSIRADGAGEAQRLTDSKTLQNPRSFSPDGKRLAYHQMNADGLWEIWTAPVEGDRDHPRLGKPEPFLRTSFSAVEPTFSLDGHWLAYSSNESGTFELYVRPFPGPGGKSQISTGGGGYPVWSGDGERLFFLSSDWHIMVADYIASRNSFTAGKPRVCSPKTVIFLGGNYPYDLAPDGKRFAVVLNPAGTGEQEQRSTDRVTVLLNFFDELRRKVPPGKN